MHPARFATEKAESPRPADVLCLGDAMRFAGGAEKGGMKEIRFPATGQGRYGVDEDGNAYSCANG